VLLSSGESLGNREEWVRKPAGDWEKAASGTRDRLLVLFPTPAVSFRQFIYSS
jgi:hypothetical protein